MLETNVEEYFKVRRMLKELSADLRDAKANHELTEEIKEISDKVKKLRKELTGDQLITELKEEIDKNKERVGLLKDIIRQEMIDSGATEFEFEGRKLELVQVMKEKRKEQPAKGKKSWGEREIVIDENLKVE